MMYPKTKCHLCKSKLIQFNSQSKRCVKKHYTVWSEGTISIYINDILFEFYPDDNLSEIKTQIFLPPIDTANYRLPEWVYVTSENYQQVLDRLDKLEIFK